MGIFKGKIHWFDERKKFGYVIDGYGNEYFFHGSNIKKARKIIIDGFNPDDEVEFDLEEGEKGKMAVNIRYIGPENPDKPVRKKKSKKPDDHASESNS